MARQRKAQQLPAWSLVIGLVAAMFSGTATSVIVARFGVPATAAQWMASAWVAAAWAGALALLLFGFVSAAHGVTARIGLIGLWLGNLANCGGIAGYPPAALLLVPPLIIGGLLVRRYMGPKYAVVYGLLPLITLVGGIAFRYSQYVSAREQIVTTLHSLRPGVAW